MCRSFIDDDLDALDAIYQVCFVFVESTTRLLLSSSVGLTKVNIDVDYFINQLNVNMTILERIANDVLSLSRIQLQVLSIHPVEFNLTAEVERIVSIFRNEVKM